MNLIIVFLTLFLVLGSERLSQAQQQDQEYNNINSKFTIQNISNNTRDSVYPQVDSLENQGYVVWQDNLFGENRMNYDILFRTVTNDGQKFGEVINLSNNSGFSEHPQLAINGNNVYIVWADNTSLNRDIYFISSSDGGQNFGEVINLSNNSADSYNQEISVYGDNLYVVWQDANKYTQGNSSISFISSNDGGKTFGDVLNISNNAGKSSFPKISSFQDNVYIAWNIDNGDKSISSNTNNTNGKILFIKSTNNGMSFDNETVLNMDEKAGEVQINANNKSVYIVWGSPDPSTNYQNKSAKNLMLSEKNITGDGIYFTKSTDNGNRFTKPTFINGQFQNPMNVEITQQSGELIVAIQAMPLDNTIEGNQDIFLMRSQDNGDSFNKAANISNNLGVSECPSMTVLSSNKLFVVWQDNSPGNNEALSTLINLS